MALLRENRHSRTEITDEQYIKKHEERVQRIFDILITVVIIVLLILIIVGKFRQTQTPTLLSLELNLINNDIDKSLVKEQLVWAKL